MFNKFLLASGCLLAFAAPAFAGDGVYNITHPDGTITYIAASVSKSNRSYVSKSKGGVCIQPVIRLSIPPSEALKQFQGDGKVRTGGNSPCPPPPQ